LVQRTTLFLPDWEVFIDDLKIFINLLLINAPLIETYVINGLVFKEEVIEVDSDLIFIDFLNNFIDFISRILSRYKNKLYIIFGNHPQFVEII